MIPHDFTTQFALNCNRECRQALQEELQRAAEEAQKEALQQSPQLSEEQLEALVGQRFAEGHRGRLLGLSLELGDLLDLLLEFFFKRIFRYRLGDVTHLLDQQHRRFLVEHLVDGDHHAHVHQDLDHFGCLHGHLLGQVGHRDRLGDLDLDGQGILASPQDGQTESVGRPTFSWVLRLRPLVLELFLLGTAMVPPE